MAFLFLIKISRDIYPMVSKEEIHMETRVQAAKPLPIRYSRSVLSIDMYFDILRDIWDAGFDTNTTLDENFVNLVSTYDDGFSRLVRDTEQFGEPARSPRRETISAVVFAAQHVTSPIVVLELLKINSRRDDFTDDVILETLIRSAVYANYEVYDSCRNACLGRVNSDSAEGGQTQRSSDRVFEWPVSQELRRTAEIFPPRQGQNYFDFIKAFCQALRAEGLERKTFGNGRTLLELAERAAHKGLFIELKATEQDVGTG
ncbi:hypothetical protein F4777DRAFT_349655 [Nemania sp. FL0916]|nr:hypothetical protein F4777DRAFT_349655 [Nemania sp. FL0916]